MTTSEKEKYPRKRAIRAYKETMRALEEQKIEVPTRGAEEELPEPKVTKPYKHTLPSSQVHLQGPTSTGSSVTPIQSAGISSDTRVWRPASYYEFGGKKRETKKEPEKRKDVVEISNEANEAYQRHVKRRRDNPQSDI